MSSDVQIDESNQSQLVETSPQKRKTNDADANEPEPKKTLTNKHFFIELKKSLILNQYQNLTSTNTQIEFTLLEKYFLENKLVFWDFPKWFDLHSKTPRNKILKDYLLSQFNPLELNSLPETCLTKLDLKLPVISATPSSTDQFKSIAERAKHEAQILQRISLLRKEGLWSIKRLPKLVEPQRIKTHWDYVLDEMVWMSTDFVQERKWKINTCRKLSAAVQKYFKEKEIRLELIEKEEQKRVKKQAAMIAKEIQLFWKQVEKIIEYKHKSINEEKRKIEMDKHLNFIVDQTEKYSSWLVEGLNQSKEKDEEDNDDVEESEEDNLEDDDDEEADNESTIESDEDKPVDNELEKLRMESELDLNDLLKDYNLDESYFVQQFNELKREKEIEEKKKEEEEEDDDDKENEKCESDDEDIISDDMSDEEDDEETIERDEKLMEQEYDADRELAELKADFELPIEELLEKLKQPSKECEDSKQSSSTSTNEQNSQNRLDTIAAQAESFQPTGYTLETTNVKTRIPTELLKHNLREYQHVGLDWLVTMYENKLNGILADEMGLGKTIQTISLLAHLAVDKGVWGPHLIVVPTSVMLNWELEFKKWCPGFKILTYYGSQKERRQKRIGWTKQNAFHVCITSYKLVIQDHAIFRRKKWKYFILDEAQNIKNFKSQRWQSLLNFQSQRRLLLTGTPLQNNLMELWSLMHFLMPHVFSSHREFQHWFNNPLKSMIEKCQEVNEQLIKRLHKVLRPFILRRLKVDVEKQMPKKYEHVVKCSLSKRQRLLYDEFMSLNSTRQKLAEGRYMSVINILMQLRKVCNHPDLFEPRPIVSSFVTESIEYQIPSLVFNLNEQISNESINLYHYHPGFSTMEFDYSAFDCHRARRLQITRKQVEDILVAEETPAAIAVGHVSESSAFFREQKLLGLNSADSPSIRRRLRTSDDLTDQKLKINYLLKLNKLRCVFHKPIYGKDLVNFVKSNLFDLKQSQTTSFLCTSFMNCFSNRKDFMSESDALKTCLNYVTETYLKFKMIELCEKFVIYVPNVRYATSEYVSIRVGNPSVSLFEKCSKFKKPLIEEIIHNVNNMSHLRQIVNSQMSTQFPEKRLIQYDCGKLQCLDKLLRDLYSGEHRVLIFTQMTRMLDVLENFLNYHGYKYLRLDGATSIEQRQVLMERFNTDKRIFCFILSTRSGGVGVNLTGADTVVFYDSDWNPTMDAQAQDRCHRIGQTRDVHIYRLISEKTVEENILKKADQKRLLSQMAIEGGCFTTAVLRKSHITELFEEDQDETQIAQEVEVNKEVEANKEAECKFEEALGMVEDESDVQAAKVLREEVRADIAEFDENEQQTNKEPEFDLNKLESEFKIIETELKPIERYALKFLESSGEVNVQFDMERGNEIEQSKKNWELKRLKQLKEEEERKAEEEEDDMMFTYTKSEVRKSTRPIKAKAKAHKKTLNENASSDKTNSLASRRIPKEIPKEIPRETPKRKPKEPIKQLSKHTAPLPQPPTPPPPLSPSLVKSENTLKTTTKEKKPKEKLPKVKKEPKKNKKETKPLNPVINNQESSLISSNSLSNQLTIENKKVDEIKVSKRGRKPKPKPEQIDIPKQDNLITKPISTEKPKILTLSTQSPITIQPINTSNQAPKPIVKAIISRPSLPIKSVFTIPSTLNRPTINNPIIITKVNTNNVINVPVTSPSKLVFRTVPNIVLQKPASVLSSSISLSPSSSSNSSSSQSK